MEDLAQEAIIPPLFLRFAKDQGFGAERFESKVLYARGGGSISALEGFLADARHSKATAADLLIVGADANSYGFHERRKRIDAISVDAPFATVIAAIPDPHIERWYLIDPAALSAAAEAPIQIPAVPHKSDRGYYKRLLRESFHASGFTPPLGGYEFGPLVAEKMDIYKSGKLDHGLRHFRDEVVRWLKLQQ